MGDPGPRWALPGAPNAKGRGGDYTGAEGRKVTGQWVVPPGRQENRSDIGIFPNLPYDTKIHYAAVHLHQFGESLTLRDVTAGTTLVVSHARNPQRRIGLDHVDTIYSEQGIPLLKSHRYELASVYDNTTAVDQDSMASMFFGVDDPEFVKPTPQQIAARTREAAAQKVASFVLHTTAGDLLATLQREQSPGASMAFVRLLQANALGHARVAQSRIAGKSAVVGFHVAATEAIRSVVTAIDGYAPLDGATVALCPPVNGELSFELRSGPVPDSRCLSFARVVWGESLIRTIATAPSKAQATVEVTRTDLFGDGSTARRDGPLPRRLRGQAWGPGAAPGGARPPGMVVGRRVARRMVGLSGRHIPRHAWDPAAAGGCHRARPSAGPRMGDDGSP